MDTNTEKINSKRFKQICEELGGYTNKNVSKLGFCSKSYRIDVVCDLECGIAYVNTESKGVNTRFEFKCAICFIQFFALFVSSHYKILAIKAVKIYYRMICEDVDVYSRKFKPIPNLFSLS